MLCAIEIGMLVAGITTLTRGEVRLGSNWSVSGWPAYVVGIILTATLPLIAAAGFVGGFMMGATGNEESLPMLICIDLGGVALSAVACLVIAAFFGSSETIDPMISAGSLVPPSAPPLRDPANPYASPVSHWEDYRR